MWLWIRGVVTYENCSFPKLLIIDGTQLQLTMFIMCLEAENKPLNWAICSNIHVNIIREIEICSLKYYRKRNMIFLFYFG